MSKFAARDSNLWPNPVLRQNSTTAEFHKCNMLHGLLDVVDFKCAPNFGEAHPLATGKNQGLKKPSGQTHHVR
jgi:hypothetical protein